MRIKYTLAVLAALTLAGAPTAAHAAEEVASSPDTQVTSTAPTAPTSTSTEVASTHSSAAPQPALATPTQASPVTESPAIAPEAFSTSESKSEPSSTTPVSSSSVKPSSSPEAPSPSTAPASLPYVLILWQNPAGAPKFPQYIISASGTASTDVITALTAVATKCGTFYQSDLYANDARTAALVAKGVLNGGDESWPDNGTQRYHTITTAPCIITPEEPTCTTDCPTDVPDEPTSPESEPTTSQPLPTPPSTTPTVPPTTLTPVETSSTSTQLVVAGNEPTAAPLVPKSTPTASTESLAYTGSDLDIGWLGGALIAAGFLFCAGRATKLAQAEKRARR